MNKAEKSVSTLAWTAADYENVGEDIPELLVNDFIHTEGELMSREDLDDWLAVTHKTFLILGENSSEQFEKLYNEFVIDIHYLEELGKITQEEATKLLSKNNYIF
jgi:hypothetical protein